MAVIRKYFFLGVILMVALAAFTMSISYRHLSKEKEKESGGWKSLDAVMDDMQKSVLEKGFLQPSGPLVPSNFARRGIITAYYRGYVQKDNLGDDLVVEIVNAFMSQKLAKKGYAFNLVQYRQSCTTPWSPDHFDFLILGGGSLLHHNWICDELLTLFKNKPILVPGTGYDDYELVLTNTTIYQSFRQGNVHTLSDHNRVTERILRKMSDNPRVIGGARGPYTSAIASKATNSTEFLPEIGDFAHLTAYLYGTDHHFNIYERFKFPRGERYVVVNMAERPGKSYELTANAATDAMRKAIFELNRYYHVIIYPMADSDIDFVKVFTANVRLASYAREKVPVSRRKRISCFLDIPDLPALGSLIKGAYFTVNYLLNANYISASYEVPFIPLIYRMKTMDLVGSMNWWDYSVQMHSVTHKDILNAAVRLIKDRNLLIERLRAQNLNVFLQMHISLEKMAAAVIPRVPKT